MALDHLDHGGVCDVLQLLLHRCQLAIHGINELLHPEELQCLVQISIDNGQESFRVSQGVDEVGKALRVAHERVINFVEDGDTFPHKFLHLLCDAQQLLCDRLDAGDDVVGKVVELGDEVSRHEADG